MKKEVLTSDWQQQWGVEWGCIVGLRNQKEHAWSCSGRRPPSAWSFAVQNKLLPKFRVRFAEKRREPERPQNLRDLPFGGQELPAGEKPRDLIFLRVQVGFSFTNTDHVLSPFISTSQIPAT